MEVSGTNRADDWKMRAAIVREKNAEAVAHPAQIVCLSGVRLKIATAIKLVKYTTMSLTVPVVPVAIILVVAASIAVTPFAAGALHLVIFAPKGAVKSITTVYVTD